MQTTPAGRDLHRSPARVSLDIDRCSSSYPRHVAGAWSLAMAQKYSYINIPADAKPRERFEGLLNRTVRITCNFQYKMLFRTLLITQFWRKKSGFKILLNFDKSLQIPCASDVDSTSFFNTRRRLSDPSVWKLSSTASCHYGTHNAIASNAGTA